jgi:SIR2-like domain
LSSRYSFLKKLKKYNHLKNIRDRLWTEDGKSRVSVMVGAGYSLNAEKLKDSFESMSLWSDLKNRISEGLSNEEIADYDVLELGQMYADEYGRANLDELLKQAIPDQNYEPSELHERLLKLPWTDVYTTNYDTLLERSLPNVYERSYQVIYDSSDISSSSSPRIVKLHGSFPSKRPFIFTNKDYESYEKEFAPFVNMVQQSIMETTLVLIGFSGDDPNFEKWTNWVHDNLGDHMPQIYMLAYGEQKREVELRKKGITLIDFEEIYKEIESSNVYERMFKDIFDFLSYEERKEKREWPYKSYYKNYTSIEDAINTLSKKREEYPGWLIMPDIIKKKNVNSIQMTSNELLRMVDGESSLVSKIKVIKELIWLYEKFLIPIDFHMHNIMKQITEESFKDIKSVDNLDDLGTIGLRLLKEARLDFDEVDFNHNINLLEQLTLNGEQKHLLLAEKILFKLANYEFSDVSLMINEWKIPKKNLEWCIKRANILCRIGEINQAIELLEECLDRVRKLLTIKSNDYQLLSLEGIILVHLIQLNKNDNFSLKNSRSRLSFLESKLSNPLKELDFIYSRVRPYQRQSGAFIRKTFDPNGIVRTNKFSNVIQTELVDSFCLLMISEEFGIQLRGGSSIKTIKNDAINNLEYLYPFYSWIKYLQIGDLKEIENFFSRKVIFKAENPKLSAFFNIVMNGIKNKENTNKQLLLEVISRLYSVLSKEEKNKIDNLVMNLFIDKEFYKEIIGKTEKVFKPLFRRIIFDKNIQEKAEFFSRLLKLPIIGDRNGELKDIILDEYEFFDPAFVFNFETEEIGSITIDVNKAEISSLISILNQEKNITRDAALARLIRLIETNNLDDEDTRRVRESIKKIIKEEKNNFSYYFLESYLVSITNDIELQKLYAKRRIEKAIPKSFNNNVISIGNGLETLLQDLRNIFPQFIKGDNDKTIVTDVMYKTWLKNFFEWWKSQEEWLLSSNDNDFFGENDDLLRMVIFLKNSFWANIPLSCISDIDRVILKEIYNNLFKCKPQIAILLIPVFMRLNVLKTSETNKILENILTNDLEISKSVFSSIYDLIVFSNKNEINMDLSEFKNELLNLHKYRKETTLLEVTNTLKFICKNAPDFFNKNEYQLISKTLRLTIEDFDKGYYENSLISDEEFKLLSESAALAGYIYKNASPIYGIDLTDWKVLTKKSKLPEVRRYAPLFN